MSKRQIIIKSLDDSESDSETETKTMRQMHGIYLVPYDGDQEFYVRIEDIRQYFPEGALGNYVTGRFLQDPVIQVEWCANSFVQLERFLRNGYILDPEYRKENLFCYEGEPVYWKYFFEWLGMSDEDIENIEIEYEDRTAEEIAEDDEEEEIRRDYKEMKKEQEEEQKLRNRMMQKYEKERSYTDYGL